MAPATVPSASSNAELGKGEAGQLYEFIARPRSERRELAISRKALRTLGVVAFFIVVVRTSWMCDDAFISLRVVDNFVSGLGLTYNPDERVQAFTNPLWVLLLSAPYALVRQPYQVCIAVSLALALASAWVLAYRVARDPVLAAVALGLLACSQAYGDFSTSGLENPLTHLLLISFYAIYLFADRRARHAKWAWLLAGLAGLGRIDALVCLVPPLVHLSVERGWRSALRLALVGMSPLLVWELFSVLYYGFPLPNPAIAKLNVDIPRNELTGQGLLYLLDSVGRDPLTGLTIATGVVIAASQPDWSRRLAGLGISLHLAYVVWVAGDFMAGRFLTAPLAVAVCVLLASAPARLERTQLAAVAGVVALVVVLSPHRPFRDSFRPGKVSETGIVRELDYYGERLGLLSNLRRNAYKRHGWYTEGRRMAEARKVAEVHSNAGLCGFGAGPGVHVVDRAGLTDAFLARIKFKYKPDWRIAHYGRNIPRGYLKTLRTGKNRIANPRLRAYYDKIRVVTRGPIWSPARLRTIWELNTGVWDDLLDAS